MSFRVLHCRYTTLDLQDDYNELVQMQHRSDQTLIGHEAGYHLIGCQADWSSRVKQVKIRHPMLSLAPSTSYYVLQLAESVTISKERCRQVVAE